MKSFIAQLRAEFLEHKGAQFWTPIIVASLMFLLIFVIMAKNGAGAVTFHVDSNGIRFDDVDDVRGALSQDVGSSRVGSAMQAIVFATTYIHFLPVLLIAIISSYFVTLSSLQTERVDRSILFWKSMPLSDFRVVITKFLSGSFGTLLVALAICICVMALGLGTSFLLSPFRNMPEGQAVLNLPVAASTVLTIIAFVFCYILWATPLYAWIMLASAWAPRSGLLHAIVPPVALVIAESMLFETHMLADEIGGRLGGYFLNMNFHLGRNQLTQGDLTNKLLDQSAHLIEGLASIHMVAGLVVAGLMLWGASEIRRRRVI